MRDGADLRGASPLVSFNHVIDPHFVAVSSICIQQFATLNLTLILTLTQTLTVTHPTVITDPQIGPRDPQIVTIQIRPTDPSRSEFCSVPLETHLNPAKILLSSSFITMQNLVTVCRTVWAYLGPPN